MAKKKTDSGAFDALKKNIEDGRIESLYAFYGEESYLIDDTVRRLRSKLVPEGLEEFNDRRFDGRSLNTREFAEAVEAMPFFSERTLIEVDDYDFSKGREAAMDDMLAILGDLPEYACVIFVYKTAEFKIDGRTKKGMALKKLFKAVEFSPLEQTRLAVWVQRRFVAAGKKIDRQTADYLVFVSDGLMASLVSETDKVASYAREELVTRADIDAVVVPSLDATVYNMTDALLEGNSDAAVSESISAIIPRTDILKKILFITPKTSHKSVFSYVYDNERYFNSEKLIN